MGLCDNCYRHFYVRSRWAAEAAECPERSGWMVWEAVTPFTLLDTTGTRGLRVMRTRCSAKAASRAARLRAFVARRIPASVTTSNMSTMVTDVTPLDRHPNGADEVALDTSCVAHAFDGS